MVSVTQDAANKAFVERYMERYMASGCPERVFSLTRQERSISSGYRKSMPDPL